MTDKELAKEYVDKLYAEKVSKEDYDKDGWILYRCEDISEAFLAGQKAKTASVEEQLEYTKTIIQDLLDNSDEYARQRAMDFLEAKK